MKSAGSGKNSQLLSNPRGVAVFTSDMEDEEIQQAPRYWRWVEQVWGYTGTLAVVAVLGGTLGRGVLQALNFRESPTNLVCCVGMTNPAAPLPPQPLGVLGAGIKPAVSHVQMLKNADGQTIEARFVDKKGKMQALPGSKVARQKVEYDTDGRVIRRVNLDTSGKPTEDAAGVAVREFGYDNAGNLVRSAYRDAQGAATAAHPTAIAEQRTTYDAKGRPLTVRNLGVNGLSKPDSGGEETLLYNYDDAAGVETRHNLIHDMPAGNDAGVAVQRITRDAAGREIKREWLDAAGNAVIHPRTGAAAIVQEYHPASGIQRSLLLDTEGKPITAPDCWSEHLVRRTSGGLPEWECYTGNDGLPRDNPALGYAEKVSLYSTDGSKTHEYFWKADGSHADCCEKRYTRSPDGVPYCLSLNADGSSAVMPTAGI